LFGNTKLTLRQEVHRDTATLKMGHRLPEYEILCKQMLGSSYYW
jgi:hypothetical protein